MLAHAYQDHLLLRQGELLRELAALRAEGFCPGDEAPLIMEETLHNELNDIEDLLNSELEKSEDVSTEDCRWELGGEG